MAHADFLIEDFRGRCFEVQVEAKITTGGSNSYGSDEPPWVDCDIHTIWNPKRNKDVSKRLFKALINEYIDWFEETLIESEY